MLWCLIWNVRRVVSLSIRGHGYKLRRLSGAGVGVYCGKVEVDLTRWSMP